MFDFTEPIVPQITAQEVKKAIDAEAPLILLDVRTTGECARGMIAGAINIPVDVVLGKILTMVPDKNALIYVYCLSGSRSVYAVEALMELGYSRVFNLTNGLLAWRGAGYTTTL